MADMIRRSDVAPALTRRRDPLLQWDPFEVMADLTAWDPLQQLERAIAPLAGRRAFAPTFDIREAVDSYIFKADVPGMKEEDLDVALTGNRLTISGQRQAEDRQEGETYYAVERSYGSFIRTFTVPEGCDLDHIEANLKDGVLSLVVPKQASVKSKRISLKSLKEGVKEGVENIKEGVENIKEKVSEKMKS